MHRITAVIPQITSYHPCYAIFYKRCIASCGFHGRRRNFEVGHCVNGALTSISAMITNVFVCYTNVDYIQSVVAKRVVF